MSKRGECEQEKRLTRRGFLNLVAGAGLIGGATTLSGCIPMEHPANTGWIPQQYQIPGEWPAQVRGRVPLDPNNLAVVRDDEKCILCGQCVEVCQNVQIVMGYYELPVVDEFMCVNCGQCSLWCPTAAITQNSHIDRVKQAIADPDKVVIVNTAPATRVSIGEEFGMPAGSWVQGEQIEALRKLGIDKVFDTNFTADLTIMEEGTELIQRITGKNDDPLPQFTSCCPGWVKFCEYFYPELLPNLSTAKSPMQMFGTLAKTYYAKNQNIDPVNIYNVSIMPCLAKKMEAARPEFNDAGKYLKNEEIRDIDAVLSIRELAIMMKENNLDINKLAPSEYDSILGESSGAGLIFGNTGGVMEAAVRSAYFLLTNQVAPDDIFNFQAVRGLENIKEASINIPGVGPLNVAVVHGLKSARELCEAVKRDESPYHFIEVMACPGGCIAGGGQPRTSVPPSDEVRKKRIASIYNKDASYSLRQSHDNKEVLALYENFLGHPVSDVAHDLLHTTYTSRSNHFIPKKLV